MRGEFTGMWKRKESKIETYGIKRKSSKKVTEGMSLRSFASPGATARLSDSLFVLEISIVVVAQVVSVLLAGLGRLLGRAGRVFERRLAL